MDEYLKYGFFAEGIIDVLTAEEMSDPETIRWIKNTAAGMKSRFVSGWRSLTAIIATLRKFSFGRVSGMANAGKCTFPSCGRSIIPESTGGSAIFASRCRTISRRACPAARLSCGCGVLGCLLRSMRNTK